MLCIICAVNLIFVIEFHCYPPVNQFVLNLHVGCKLFYFRGGGAFGAQKSGGFGGGGGAFGGGGGGLGG